MNSITRTCKHNYSLVEKILAGSPPDVERLRDISTGCSPARQWIDDCPRQNIMHSVFMSIVPTR